MRRVSFGVGVERVFPANSPSISSIEVLRQGRVRRAKLYYLRGLKGKAARLQRVERAEIPETVATEKRNLRISNQGIAEDPGGISPGFFVGHASACLLSTSADSGKTKFRLAEACATFPC